MAYKWATLAASILFMFLLILWVSIQNAVTGRDARIANCPRWSDPPPSNGRIRMLWIIHDYVPFVNAGSEICTHTLNKHLLRASGRGFDVWVASPAYPRCVYEGVHCFDLNDTSLFFKLLETADILNTHSHYRNRVLHLCRVTGKPYIEWVHTNNHLRSVGSAPWMDPACTGRQWTVFNAQSLKELRPDAHNARIFHPIVDYREYTVARPSPRYVTLSNLNENKGGRLLLQLARALPEMEFLGICGGYREQILDRSLPNVRYVPHTPNIKDLYAQTWVQILPSREETWGRTAIEAMASGIPVVASKTPGLQECCGSAALYCARDDISAWVQILRKLKSDAAFYAERSAAAYDRARALDPVPQIADMVDWLQTVVAPSAVPGQKGLHWIEKTLWHW